MYSRCECIDRDPIEEPGDVGDQDEFSDEEDTPDLENSQEFILNDVDNIIINVTNFDTGMVTTEL